MTWACGAVRPPRPDALPLPDERAARALQLLHSPGSAVAKVAALAGATGVPAEAFAPLFARRVSGAALLMWLAQARAARWHERLRALPLPLRVHVLHLVHNPLLEGVRASGTRTSSPVTKRASPTTTTATW